MKTSLFKRSKILRVVFVLSVIVSLAVFGIAKAGRWARDENGKVYDVEKKWEERYEVEHRQDALVAEIAATQPNVYKKYIQNAIDTKVLNLAKQEGDARQAGQTETADYLKNVRESLQQTSSQNVNIYQKTTAEWATAFGGNSNGQTIAYWDGTITIPTIDRTKISLQVKSGDLITYSAENYKTSMCIGWGCLAAGYMKGGGGNNTRSDNDITVPPGRTRFPGFKSSPGLTPPPVHSPTPIRTEIIFFEITNFRLQTALNGEEYYQIFKEQMAINYPNYQLNLAWAVSGANSCVASCKYAKIDDYQANQNWDELQAQSWPCGQNIDGQTTFSGEVDNQYSSAKTKPKENGIIRYTLSCQGETGSDTKHLLAVIQSLRWHEAIPIIDQ